MDTTDKLYKSLSKAIILAVSLVVFLWFLFKIASVLLIFLIAIVFALILNAPTSWLVRKGLNRTVSALLVFFIILIVTGLVGWLVVPKLIQQISVLIWNLPGYLIMLEKQLNMALGNYPGFQDTFDISTDQIYSKILSLDNLISRIGRFSLSLIGVILILIFFFSMVAYMVITPGPLIELYLKLFPIRLREKAATALSHASTMLIGWMWANLVVGALEAILVAIFLSIMNIPGVLVWAGLAFFAELVPKLGPYIMSAPPILIAFSIDPTLALWISVFYILMIEFMADFVMPRVRASTMKIHPVSSLFLMLAMGAAFGILGALMGVPMVAIIKAYYTQFYLNNQEQDHLMESRINKVIYRN